MYVERGEKNIPTKFNLYLPCVPERNPIQAWHARLYAHRLGKAKTSKQFYNKNLKRAMFSVEHLVNYPVGNLLVEVVCVMFPFLYLNM